jgi:hypothetical protein
LWLEVAARKFTYRALKLHAVGMSVSVFVSVLLVDPVATFT